MKRQLAFPIILAISLFSGCSFAPHIANDAVDYNLAQEKANNELLLLNVARAFRGYPMYFSGLTEVTGDLQFNSSLEAELPIGGDADNIYPFTPSLTYQSNPSFKVSILDDKDFIRGILTPISKETVEYYWDYGWPREALLHLFVEKLEVFVYDLDRCKGKKTIKATEFATIENLTGRAVSEAAYEAGKEKRQSFCIATLFNEPDQPNEFKLFQDALNSFDIDVQANPSDGTVASDLGLTDLINIQEIVAAPEQRLTLVADNGVKTFKLDRSKSDIAISIKIGSAGAGAAQIPNAGSQTTKSLTWANIYLRSPQAMLFYLGEVLRAAEWEDAPVWVQGDDGKNRQLFHLERSSDLDKQGAAAVTYRGERYSVPECTADDRKCWKTVGRTWIVLAIVNQLIGQQKSTDKLPGTQTVKLIGN